MAQLRHLLGILLFLALLALAYWAWSAYPQLGRIDALRPWNGVLTTWRIPLLALAAFALLSVLQWLVDRFTSKAE